MIKKHPINILQPHYKFHFHIFTTNFIKLFNTRILVKTKECKIFRNITHTHSLTLSHIHACTRAHTHTHTHTHTTFLVFSLQFIVSYIKYNILIYTSKLTITKPIYPFYIQYHNANSWKLLNHIFFYLILT
jgi:hypothetical protein